MEGEGGGWGFAKEGGGRGKGIRGGGRDWRDVGRRGETGWKKEGRGTEGWEWENKKKGKEEEKKDGLRGGKRGSARRKEEGGEEGLVEEGGRGNFKRFESSVTCPR